MSRRVVPVPSAFEQRCRHARLSRRTLLMQRYLLGRHSARETATDPHDEQRNPLDRKLGSPHRSCPSTTGLLSSFASSPRLDRFTLENRTPLPSLSHFSFCPMCRRPFCEDSPMNSEANTSVRCNERVQGTRLRATLGAATQ